MIGRGQQWIVDDLDQGSPAEQAPDDKNYAEDSFHQDINGILTAKDSQGYAAWSKVQKVLQQRYETELLPAVRKKIADEQARQYAPQLMTKNWRPTEADLLSSRLPLQQDTLISLRVWKNAPPQPKETSSRRLGNSGSTRHKRHSRSSRKHATASCRSSKL